MTRARDPISLVYDALWEMLESREALRSMIRLASRIRYTGRDRSPEKSVVNTADLPELRLYPAGTIPHVQRTSNSSSLLKAFEVQVSTGDIRVDAALFPIEFEVLRAFTDWGTVLQALRWKSQPFVTHVAPTLVTEGSMIEDQERKVHGWACIWRCEVLMFFSTVLLREDA